VPLDGQVAQLFVLLLLLGDLIRRCLREIGELATMLSGGNSSFDFPLPLGVEGEYALFEP